MFESTKSPHFPLSRKVGQLRERKRVPYWSIYIISLCCLPGQWAAGEMSAAAGLRPPRHTGRTRPPPPPCRVGGTRENFKNICLFFLIIFLTYFWQKGATLKDENKLINFQKYWMFYFSKLWKNSLSLQKSKKNII